jgi:hypothetical protein
MREDENELCTLRWEDINQPPSNNLFVWRDAQRHGHAVMFLARQLAFKETGEQATANEITAHLKKHEARLIVKAEKMIATRWEFEDWRFPRRP